MSRTLRSDGGVGRPGWQQYRLLNGPPDGCERYPDGCFIRLPLTWLLQRGTVNNAWNYCQPPRGVRCDRLVGFGVASLRW